MSTGFRIRLVFTFLFVSALLPMNVMANQDAIKTTEEAISKVKESIDQCWKIRIINSKEAIRIGEEAMIAAKALKLNHEVARLSNFLGVIYIHFLYNTKDGISHLHHALEISMYEKDSVQLGFAYNNLGDAYLLTGNTTLSLEYTETSLKIFENIKDTVGIAYGYINLGSVYRKEGDYEAAIVYFERAKAYREQIGDPNASQSVLLELAETYHGQGDIERALRIYQESYEYQISINNVLYTGITLNLLGHANEEIGELDKAYDNYSEAIKVFTKIEYQAGLLDAHLGLALVYAKQKSIKKGEEVLNKALEIAFELDLDAKVLETYKYYSKFYQHLGMYHEASVKSEQFLLLYDSILSVQKFETLNELQKKSFNEFNHRLTEQALKASKLKETYLFIIVLLMLTIVIGSIWRVRVNRKMNLNLKSLNYTKDKLFSVISHDLKNPFNSLLGFSEILIENIENKDYENIGKYAEIINYSAEENLKLLTNLLNWSRSQTGQIRYQPSCFSFDKLLKEIQNLFQIEADKLGINLVFNLSVRENINADSDILRIILNNLISNAFKYTNEDGKIEVFAEIKQDKLIIKIIDNGIGMSKKTKAQLFNSTQLKSIDGLRKEKGTGLGLMICAELIALHKGDIKVLSELGYGSTFIISIPQIN